MVRKRGRVDHLASKRQPVRQQNFPNRRNNPDLFKNRKITGNQVVRWSNGDKRVLVPPLGNEY